MGDPSRSDDREGDESSSSGSTEPDEPSSSSGSAEPDEPSPSPDDERPDEPSDEEVVRTAAEAAEGLVFARYRQSEVDDLDVTVTFEEGVLEVDVYLNAPEETADPEAVADEAALAARRAVDDLFGEA
jgi:hypothetical protein